MDSARSRYEEIQKPSRANKSSNIVGEPVTWVIRRSTYKMEESSDGLPIFNHSGFSYKATTAGAGSISWYIRCMQYSDENHQCFVQGVRHTDGRLLMLRKHNHSRSQITKTPSKRAPKVAPASAPAKSSKTATKKSPTPRKSSRVSLPKVLPNMVNGSGRGRRTKETKLPRPGTRKSNKTTDVDDSLVTRMQARWKAARRRSLLDHLGSAVEMACL